jgi:hypothetical protein
MRKSRHEFAGKLKNRANQYECVKKPVPKT